MQTVGGLFTEIKLFDDFEQAKTAVVELERIGVSHDDISVLANNATEMHGRNKAVSTEDGVGMPSPKMSG